MGGDRRRAGRTVALAGSTVLAATLGLAGCSGDTTSRATTTSAGAPAADSATTGPSGTVGGAGSRAGARCTAADAEQTIVPPGDPARWAWLAGTTWVVPASGLAALHYDPSTGVSTPVKDQTVYTIDRYTDGYFSGKTVVQSTQEGQAPHVTLRNLVANVTPQGSIMLTFIPPGPDGSSRTTVGLGQFRCLDGRWSMEMQMSTGTTDTVNHWAYMVSCETGDPCEQQVPGTTLSLAAFMAQTPTEP